MHISLTSLPLPAMTGLGPPPPPIFVPQPVQKFPPLVFLAPQPLQYWFVAIYQQQQQRLYLIAKKSRDDKSGIDKVNKVTHHSQRTSPAQQNSRCFQKSNKETKSRKRNHKTNLQTTVSSLQVSLFSKTFVAKKTNKRQTQRRDFLYNHQFRNIRIPRFLGARKLHGLCPGFRKSRPICARFLVSRDTN